jgi:ribosomal-protein-alanine N-acetyltransferase
MAENLYSDLETERLFLRILSVKDAPQVLDYLFRNQAFFKPWSPQRDPHFYTLDYQEEKLLLESQLLQEGSLLKWWIFEKKRPHPPKIIGDITFANIIRGAFQSCHLGYKMDAHQKNKGYMTEALTVSIASLFHERKLHRIEANIMPRNQRSIRVVEKLNFINEGISKKYLQINGVWEDHLHYVLLNSALE